MENAGIGGTIGLRAAWPPVGLSVATLDAMLNKKEIYHRPPLELSVYAF